MASFPVPSAPLFASAPAWASPSHKHHPLYTSCSLLSVNDELIWDNGTVFPEPCIDRIADTVGKYEALAWLCGGLSFFASLGLMAVWND